MIGLVLRIVALILFVVAGLSGHVGSYQELDLVCFGLAAWVLATVVGAWRPPGV